MHLFRIPVATHRSDLQSALPESLSKHDINRPGNDVSVALDIQRREGLQYLGLGALPGCCQGMIEI